MSHTLCLLLLAAASLASPAPTPTAPPPTTEAEPVAHVLGPTAEPAIRRALGMVGAPGRDGLTLQASVEQSTIRVVGTRGPATVPAGPVRVLDVTLVHPSVAPTGTWVGAGVALVESPGPNDPAALRALEARLEAASEPIPWTTLAPARPDAADTERVQRSLDEARYLVAAGDLAEGRAVLEALPEQLEPAVALRLAALWRRAGDIAQANKTLDRLGTLRGARAGIAALIRDPKGALSEPRAAVGDARGEAACEYTELAAFLAQLGRAPDGLAVAQLVLERAPDCRAAWESALHRHLEARDFEGALALADRAVARYPDDDAISAVAASAYQARGQYQKATPLLLAVARRNPDDEGIVRVLLSAILRDTDYRQAYKDQLVGWLETDPSDHLAQFLLGIIHHYENAFERSNELLRPLEESMGHQSRLHIYLAMNDFNLGHREAALARLNAAAKRPIPDPDIFYCRAEIERDTDRAQALADLRRYKAQPEGGYMANPDKERRVSRMIGDLEACLADGRAVCESEWEHPRLRHHETDAQARARREAEEPGGPTAAQLAVGGLLALGLLLAAARLWRRRQA